MFLYSFLLKCELKQFMTFTFLNLLGFSRKVCFLMFISLPGFKRGADPGMPEPSVLRWALWAGHVKISVFTQKAAEDDRFCLSVCSGDEDGNYRPVHKLLKTRPSSHDRTLARIWTLCWDVNTSLSRPPNAFVLFSDSFSNIALRNTKCFLSFFLLNLWTSL